MWPGSQIRSARGCTMAGRGKTRNSQALPKANSGVYGGTTDPQPGDEQQGGWSRQEREEMNQLYGRDRTRAAQRPGDPRRSCRDGELTLPRWDAILADQPVRYAAITH